MAELTDTSVKTSPQIYVVGVAFILFHVAALGVFYTGVSTPALIVLAASYFVRGFGITAGYHRLLAHRSFQTSRFVQFLFAFAGCQAFQGGIIRQHYQICQLSRTNRADVPGNPDHFGPMTGGGAQHLTRRQSTTGQCRHLPRVA